MKKLMSSYYIITYCALRLMIEYKVVELSIVTDQSIEEAVNTWTQQDWVFDSLHFAMGAGSKRPAMVFIFFVRSLETPEDVKEGEG